MTVTPQIFPITIPGSSLGEQATNLAGALAELGIVSLTLVGTPRSTGKPTVRHDLACRRTDLPAVLLALEPGATVESAQTGLSFTRSDSSLHAHATTRPQADALAVQFGRHVPR